MRKLKLTTIGAYCAVLTTISFVAGIALMASSGVQVLIPETGGHKTIDWIDDVNGASGAFFAGAWLVILGGFLGLVAMVGFYFALRDAGPVMLLAPILAWAILVTRAVARWIGWLGIVTAVFAGWLGLFSPASSVIDGITFVG